MATRERAGATGAFNRIVSSRVFVPMSLVCSLALALGIGVNLLIRAGNWPPTFAQPNIGVVISALPSPSPTTVAHAIVLGAVRTPGVYPIEPGALAKDLIQLAGGALSAADLSRVDLTAPLQDGASIYVPRSGELIPIERDGKIALNQASAIDLRNALGISLTICKRIVAYRSAHGNFTAISQLLLVPISQATFDRVKNLVAV